MTVTRLGLGLDLELEKGLLYNKTPQEAFLARKKYWFHRHNLKLLRFVIFRIFLTYLI